MSRTEIGHIVQPFPSLPLFPAKISNCETSRTYLKWSLIARQRASYCHQRVDTESRRSALNFLKGDKRGEIWRRHRRITSRAVASEMFDKKKPTISEACAAQAGVRRRPHRLGQTRIAARVPFQEGWHRTRRRQRGS